MSYINSGATYRETGERVPTKKALKAAMAADPHSVVFDPTSMFNDQTDIDGGAIQLGVKLSVVGPDPYSSRKWYATVERTQKGVRVS